MKYSPIHNLLLTGLGMALLCGCSTTPQNPSFSINTEGAKFCLAEQSKAQFPLPRPLVVLSGYADPGIAPYYLRNEFRKIFHDERVIGMSFYTAFTLEECRDRLIDRVTHTFPTADPNQTILVDVVAHSMGGLVARFAAMDIPGRPRLRIARLFTIATPHQGAIISKPPSPDPRIRAMQADSGFLQALDQAFASRDYELVCYTRLGDIIVDPACAAPPNYPLWWVPNRSLSESHLEAPGDPRILLDITLRLRNQPSFTIEPAAPLPE